MNVGSRRNWKGIALVAVLLVCGSLRAEEGFKPLFNGKDLNGWKAVRSQGDDGLGPFKVDAEQGAIHVYAREEAGSAQDSDCLYTEKEYSHFVLKMEYKWLENRFAPRVNQDRDAGLLFHVHGDLTEIWPKSVEMQLGESDTKKTKDRYVTGDLWVIGKDLQVLNERKGEFYAPGADPVYVGANKDYDKSYIPRGNEKPHGEWNEITLTVRGGQKALFELNGNVVNRISDLTHVVDGVRVPLAKGHIGLQAEYAELMYRNIRIKELPVAAPGS